MKLTEDKKPQKMVYIDEKVLNPKDVTKSSVGFGKADKTKLQDLRPDGLQKAFVGKPKVYDLKGNLLADEENLVVLIGREYLAQMLAGNLGNNPKDYTSYKVTHFGVGTGGTSSDCPPVTIGPFDDDNRLYAPVSIGVHTVGGNNKDDNYLDITVPAAANEPLACRDPYPEMDLPGGLKKIEYIKADDSIEGEITIVEEEHTINTCSDHQEQVNYFTAVRYTMYLRAGEDPLTQDPGEPIDKPFKFNEAGLFAVKYDSNGNVVYDSNGRAEHIMFARFTTLDKYLESADGIMIEWYILV